MSNDVWTELIEPKNKQWKEKVEVINGIQYRVFTLKKEIISKDPNLVKEVRGIGLMIGLVAIENNEILIQKLREERLLVVKAGMNVIRMLPPLILEIKHIREAISKIDKAFSNFKND